MRNIILVFTFLFILSACSAPLGLKESNIIIDSTHWQNLPSSCLNISRLGNYQEMEWHIERAGVFECRVINILVDDALEPYNAWQDYNGNAPHKVLLAINPFEYNPVRICCRQDAEHEPVCVDEEIIILCLPKDRDLSNVR